MSCSENALLKGVKDKQKELDTLLEQGKDGLSSMTSKVNELKADLSSFVPVLPEVPSLQGDLLKLGDITSAAGLATKIAELKTSFGGVVSDLDAKLASLGLNSFPPSINAADICSALPNVETIDGVATEVPAESKIPEKEPEKPVAKEVILTDLEELNRTVLNVALKANAGPQIRKAADALNPDVRKKLKQGIRNRYFTLTWSEFFIEVANAGGGNYDDLYWTDYPEAVLKELQSQLSAEHPLGWDFTAVKLEKAYDTTKTLLPKYAEAEDFATACAQAVARRMKKVG